MKNQAQVVVIGGGVVGASILYHLSKLGCHDAIMLERSELGSMFGWVTSGGFAHASKTSVTLAMVPKEFALRNNGWTAELLGQSLKATLTNKPLFYANASRMRS